MARVFIGTSGWHYKHWRGRFYPGDLPIGEWFDFYQERLDSVEINNSFYHLLDADVVSRWARQTARGFVFAVKGSRYLTHNKKLKDPEEPLRRFFESLRAFGRRLGPIVFQLPPRWSVNAERLDAFLAQLPRGRYAVELRNETWLCEDVYAVLRRHNAAFCIFHLAGYRTPMVVTADFIYVRLHGPGERKYQGNYTTAALSAWAKRIRTWSARGLDVYLYFDNDQEGFAANNAVTLTRYCRAMPSRAKAAAKTK